MSKQGGNQSQPSTSLDSTQTPPSALNQVESSKKRKLTSKIWDDFEKVRIDGVDYGICKLCSTKLEARRKKGTKSLLDHLETHKRSQSGTGAFCTHVFDQENSRHELVHMIILHGYPLSMVNHIGFRRYSSSLQPLFKMLSQNTVKREILKIYDCEKDKTYKLLEKLESRVAITTHMWTDEPIKKGFLAITAHYIDESWMLQSRILRFAYFPTPHDKEVLCDVIIGSLMDWKIDHKLSTITMDNCTTNGALFDNLVDKLSRNSLLLDGKVLHMRCCAHILNLIVQDGLMVVGKEIEIIRDSVAYWTASSKRVEKFEEVAKQLHIPCTKKLCLDCKTRWNSTCIMLQTALMYKDVFSQLEQHERHYTSSPTKYDWESAKEIYEKLNLFYNVTELCSGITYPTASCYFPKLCDIKLALSRWIENPSVIISDMAVKMLDKWEKYWSDINTIMGVAVVLDPRYKMKLLEYYLPRIYYEDDYPGEIQKIRQICYDLLHEYQSKFPSHSGVTDLEHDVNNDDPLLEYDLFVSRRRRRNMMGKSELDIYLEEDVFPRIPNFDVLDWWKTNGIKFPTLQRIARDILAVPVSTVALESDFSSGSRVISPHHSKLHPTTLEALVCTRSWLRNGSNDKFCASTMYEEEDDPNDVLEVR